MHRLILYNLESRHLMKSSPKHHHPVHTKSIQAQKHYTKPVQKYLYSAVQKSKDLVIKKIRKKDKHPHRDLILFRALLIKIVIDLVGLGNILLMCR